MNWRLVVGVGCRRRIGRPEARKKISKRHGGGGAMMEADNWVGGGDCSLNDKKYYAPGGLKCPKSALYTNIRDRAAIKGTKTARGLFRL